MNDFDYLPLSAIGHPNAPWLEPERPEHVDCPICCGTGYGLGDFTHQCCPACLGDGILHPYEAQLASERYGNPEDYWCVMND